MIRASVREWETVPLATVGGRAGGDRLLRVAQEAQRKLRLGGADGERVLVNGVERLRAQQVVGVVTAPGVSLEILPKIDGLAHDEDGRRTRTNLVRMLARTLDLKMSPGALTALKAQSHDLLEIVIRMFVERLFAAAREGLPRRYVGQEADLATLRGRLDVRRQFTTLAVSPDRLACRYDELSVDTPLNQVMKATVARLTTLARSADNQRRLAELAFMLADVSSVPERALAWDRIVLDRSNKRWHDLLALARLLLASHFQTTSSGAAPGFALLFEMNTLFEEFVGRTMRRALTPRGYTVSLQGPRRFALHDEAAGRGRFQTKPDIVVHRHGRPVLIVDTKWKRLKGQIDCPKRGVAQGDVYQMMAYAHVYDCERLMLLYPHHDGLGSPAPALLDHRIPSTSRRLSVATLSLADLGAIEDSIVALVEACDIEGQLRTSVGRHAPI